MLRSLSLAAAAASLCAASLPEASTIVSGLKSSIGRAAFAPMTLSSSGGRRLSDQGGWACQPGENPDTSCCDAVPKFMAIFNGTTCGQHFGVLSIALGMDAASLPIPGVTVPSSPADVQTALGAYCPSYCSFAVKALAAEYQAKPSNGRLCPQVLDGTWRLNMACDKMGSDYCLPTYQTITAAFDGKGDSTVTGDQLDGMCSNHCTRMIQDDAQAAAAKIGSKMVPGDMSDNGVLQDYAFRRASSINRMVDVLCTRDVADGQVCAAKTNLLSRLDTSVGSEGPIVITPAPPAASSAPSAASSSSSRALAADGQDISGQDDSQSDDSLATLLNPKLRPGFACTFCGHNILSGLLDLADIFGNNLPAGGSSLTVDRIRTMLEHGCPVYNGRTCMQMLAFSSPASTSYDPTLGMAVQGLQLCASEMASGMATCSESCKYALNAANDAFGCCFGHALEMKVALGDMPALNVMTIVNAAKSSCGVDFGKCRAGLERFFASNFASLNANWAASHKASIGNALSKDYARITGQDASIFEIISTTGAASGDGTVVVMGVVAPSNTSSLMIIAQVRAAASQNTASYPNLAALMAADPASGYSSDGSMDTTDVSDQYAPAPREPIDAPTSGAAGLATQGFVTAAIVVLATAAALAFRKQ